MPLPQPFQSALPPAPSLPTSPSCLSDDPLPPHWLQTDRHDDVSFQPSDSIQPDLHIDDSLQPMDHSHHPPVASPSHHSYVGGSTAQHLLFHQGPPKLKEEKEDWARAPKASTPASPAVSLLHGNLPATNPETKQDHGSPIPLNPAPDSELYWSPWSQITRRATQLTPAPCTMGARTFFNRLLDDLATERAGTISLGPEAKADIHWFLCFLGHFNRVTLIKTSVAQHVLHVDSCLQGGGGLCSGLQFYKILYPQFLQDLGLSISSLECWILLVAARIWLPTLSGSTVSVFCDNWATDAAINSGRATDPIIRGSLWELWWLAASHDVQLEVRHKPGAEMIAADTLSRATTSTTAAAKFAQFAQAAQESEVQPPPSVLLPPFPF